MQEENVSRIGFAAWRTTQEQRNFAVGLRVLRKIVIKTDRVLLVVAEIFAHRASGEWRDVLHRGRFGSGRGNDNRVIHRSIVRECLYDLRDRGSLLADCDVNANHVAAALIKDRIENNGGLTGLPVA